MSAARASRSITIPVKALRRDEPVTQLKSVAPAKTTLSTPQAPAAKSILPRPSISLPEHTRRKIMWWTVGVAMIGIVGGWVALFDTECRGRNFFDTTLTKIRDTFSGLHFGQNNNTAAEKEIRQLDSQVFPDLSE